MGSSGGDLATGQDKIVEGVSEDLPRERRLAPLRTPDLDYGEPGSRAAAKVVARIEKIEASMRSSAYSHRLRVRPREGRYDWDCSAMVNWVLGRAAPTALATIDRERPVAISYVRTIKAAPKHKHKNGWRELRNIHELRPGDVFAWRRPAAFESSNTGHVGFALSSATPVPDVPNAYRVRIVDASQYTHDDDTRDPNADGGWGAGTIAFVTDDAGHPVAYGWFGDPTRVWETEIVFGRVTR